MAKLAKQITGPPTALKAATLYVHQPAVTSEYSEFKHYAAPLPDADVFFEPTLYTSKPQGDYIGQCARMLISSQVGYYRRFHSGLRYISCRPGYLLLFVTARAYARKRVAANAACAQLFFQKFVCLHLSGWSVGLLLPPNCFNAEDD